MVNLTQVTFHDIHIVLEDCYYRTYLWRQNVAGICQYLNKKILEIYELGEGAFNPNNKDDIFHLWIIQDKLSHTVCDILPISLRLLPLFYVFVLEDLWIRGYDAYSLKILCIYLHWQVYLCLINFNSKS